MNNGREGGANLRFVELQRGRGGESPSGGVRKARVALLRVVFEVAERLAGRGAKRSEYLGLQSVEGAAQGVESA
jgi:hypothetical protein